jgi:hypothetical protein
MRIGELMKVRVSRLPSVASSDRQPRQDGDCQSFIRAIRSSSIFDRLQVWWSELMVEVEEIPLRIGGGGYHRSVGGK